MKRAVLSFALTVACGASSTTTTTTAETPQGLPSASSNATASAPSDPRSCDRLQPVASGGDRSAPAPPSVGQMTEQAARAKRLFDAERWPEAEAALTAVARGESGDDPGNAQLAQYHLGIAIFREKDFRRSYAVFSEIAHKRSHVKHAETLLWLVKFLLDQPALVDFADFGTYTREDAARFNNPSQREVFSAASVGLGRERLQEGARDEANAFFANVDPDGPLGALAASCRARAR